MRARVTGTAAIVLGKVPPAVPRSVSGHSSKAAEDGSAARRASG